MVGVAKKLMDKARKEGKPWISGLFDYRVTPQSGSITSPLELMTQCTPRKKYPPWLRSALGAPEMHQTHQELIKRQGNKPERNYIEIPPGTPVWVQHRQNAIWEPATVTSQCASNSYWIVQENSAEQPKVYRCTRHMLKIRSTATDGKQKAQARQCAIESRDTKFHIPAIPYGNRNVTSENSPEDYNSNSVQPPLPTLDLLDSENSSENREESQIVEPLCTNDSTLENAPDAPNVPVHQCKSTRENFGKPANKYSDFYL